MGGNRTYNNMNMNNMKNQGKYDVPLGPNEALKVFTYSYKGKQPERVQVSGSFNDWTEKYDLIYDPQRNIWELSIKMNKGKYTYK